VCCFDSSGFTTYTTADGLLDNGVLDTLQDREGSFWLIHHHSGMTRFDPETIRLLTAATVSETLIQTSEGALWFGDVNKLCRLYKGEQRCYTLDSKVWSLMEDSNKRLWVGTIGRGLYCYDSTDAVWEGNPKHFTYGRIWMGGFDGGGLSYVGSPTARKEKNSDVGSPTARKEKNSEDEGRAASLHNYTTEHGLPSDCVISIMEDDAGRLWIGTVDGH